MNLKNLMYFFSIWALLYVFWHWPFAMRDDTSSSKKQPFLLDPAEVDRITNGNYDYETTNIIIQHGTRTQNFQTIGTSKFDTPILEPQTTQDTWERHISKNIISLFSRDFNFWFCFVFSHIFVV